MEKAGPLWPGHQFTVTEWSRAWGSSARNFGCHMRIANHAGRPPAETNFHMHLYTNTFLACLWFTWGNEAIFRQDVHTSDPPRPHAHASQNPCVRAKLTSSRQRSQLRWPFWRHSPVKHMNITYLHDIRLTFGSWKNLKTLSLRDSADTTIIAITKPHLGPDCIPCCQALFLVLAKLPLLLFSIQNAPRIRFAKISTWHISQTYPTQYFSKHPTIYFANIFRMLWGCWEIFIRTHTLLDSLEKYCVGYVCEICHVDTLAKLSLEHFGCWKAVVVVWPKLETVPGSKEYNQVPGVVLWLQLWWCQLNRAETRSSNFFKTQMWAVCRVNM